MSTELISILVLAAMFVLATVVSINIGILAFFAAFVLGMAVLTMDGEQILTGFFPADLVVTLIGVTFLFAIAQNNGTIDWLVGMAVRGVRGRIVAIPWIMFLITGALTAVGAVSPAAVAIIAPVALGFAYRYRISPLLMGLMVIHGAQAGGFSPISIYGSITNSIVAGSGLESSPLTLFLTALLFNLAIALIAFLLLGGPALVRRRAGSAEATAAEPDEPGRVGEPGAGPTGGSRPAEGPPGAETPAGGGTGTVTRTAEREELADAYPGATPYRVVTLVGIVGLAIGAFLFDLNVGLTAISISVVLVMISPGVQRTAIAQVSWPVVLLIGGMLTYVGVLQEIGTVDYVSAAISSVGSALLAALLLFYLGAVVSAFASSTALIGALIPLAIPFLMTGEVGAVAVVVGLAVSSTVVDVSPFSTNGALVLANAREDGNKDAFYRRLLLVGGLVVLLAPLLAWLILVVPGWL